MRLSLIILFVFSFTTSVFGQGTEADYDRMQSLGARFANRVSRTKVEPNWFDNNAKFWFQADLPRGEKEFVIVDCEKGTRTVVKEGELPKKDEKKSTAKEQPNRQRRPRGNTSPNGEWSVQIKNFNVILRNQKTKEETELSRDGTEKNSYGRVYWAPNSMNFIVMKTKDGGDRRVTLVESSPSDQLQPKASTYDYLKPGDPIPQPKPILFSVAEKKIIPVQFDLMDNPWDISYETWTEDSERFLFVYNQRGHTVMRVLAIDAKTGTVTPIVNEECSTFFDYAYKLYFNYLPKTQELIWMSERSGWNHLYLIDTKTGKVKNPITTGDWLVRKVTRVNIEKRQIEFEYSGQQPDQDPYFVHHGRIDFDGQNFTALTDADGTHAPLQFSPDRQYYLVSHSRVDRAPVTELRRTSDGKKILTVEEADSSRLEKAGWKAPEVFVHPGRDGKTPIWGLIHRPTHYDAKKKYPVIEYIYAGPHGQHVPKSFRPIHNSPMRMAELGFIVVQIDGMGTNWRSKAFHDVCWKNLGDSGFPDRILWIQAAAKKHPEMDLSRGCGIFGGSAGGQSSTRALLAFNDFYTVAVSDCGCHDNRMDKIWWNELWMSWPIGKHYEDQSNVTQAKNLKGKLMLVVGELDRNVDPASTMQVVNALIKANKDFDFLLIPGAGHGACESPYGQRRRADFFVRHLMGVEPRR